MTGSASAYSANDGYVRESWSADSTYLYTDGVHYAFYGVVCSAQGAPSIGGGQSGSAALPTPLTGNVGWAVTALYGTGGWLSVPLGSGTVYITPPPSAPPTPSAPSGLTATDNTSSVDLSASTVSHPSGTTLTYEVQRNGTTIATGLSSPAYTDSSPGATRPITYGIRAKSVGDGSTYSGTSYSSWTTVQTNGVPYAPTLVSPADGVPLDLTGVQRFRWTPGFPTSSDSQSGFTIEFSSDGGTTWTAITKTSPNSYYDAAAGYFTAGSWQWCVKVAGQTYTGPYSSAGHFTAATPSTDLTITSPTSGAYVGQQQEIDWSVADQASYQIRRVADDNGTADTDDVYYDSNEVPLGGARSVTLTFETNNRPEHVQLRTKNAAGLWTSWVDVLVFVSYTPPATAIFTAEPIVILDGDEPQALVRYHITTPSPELDVPYPTSANIAARPVGATVAEWSRSGVSPNGYVDFQTPASGVEYECQVTTVAESGATASTDWMR